MRREVELKPCPFCSSRVKQRNSFMRISTILCDRCGAMVTFIEKEKHDEARQAWNTRSREWKG